MTKDLRTFMNDVLKANPNDIRVVRSEIDPKFELIAAVERFEAINQDPIVLFTNVKGASMPVIANVCATYDRLALAMGATKEGMVDEYAKREANRLPPKYVENAPVKEIMLKGDQLDLGRLPWITHNVDDGGPYFSAPVTLLRDPDSGKVNAGCYRIQIKSPTKLMMNCNPTNHGDFILRKHKATKKPLQVAMVIGHHPGFLMAGVAKLEDIGGELEVAGGLMGEPLEVVKGETVDLPIPARAEIVIEGIIEDPNAEEEEGPFGEWTKYTAEVTAGKRMKPWITPTALYMRKEPIFHMNVAAHNDHSILGSIPRMGSILRRIRGVVPSVKAVNLPTSGCARSHLYISLKKGADGEPKRAALMALATSPQIKLVICVDDDINVFNEEDVLWALATRFQADKDMTVMPYFLGAFSNPTAYDYSRTKHGWLETKVICDATKPLPPAEFPPRAKAPVEVFNRLTLEKLQVVPLNSDLIRRFALST